MIYFTAHTFKCVCHCRRAMFRVLGMYDFACTMNRQANQAQRLCYQRYSPGYFVSKCFLLNHSKDCNQHSRLFQIRSSEIENIPDICSTRYRKIASINERYELINLVFGCVYIQDVLLNEMGFY